jgi:hypothetical protein
MGTQLGHLDLARSRGRTGRTLLLVRSPQRCPPWARAYALARSTRPIGAVIGEWVGASQGLGYSDAVANAAASRPILMFAAVLTSAALVLYTFRELGCARLSPPPGTRTALTRVYSAVALAFGVAHFNARAMAKRRAWVFLRASPRNGARAESRKGHDNAQGKSDCRSPHCCHVWRRRQTRGAAASPVRPVTAPAALLSGSCRRPHKSPAPSGSLQLLENCFRAANLVPARMTER